jgi:NAD(P)-dependent dehydrogenase (short-subunit alcohol dehydrogenase family)
MQLQGSGAIVNNSSVGGLKQGIRTNAVNPGLIDTQIARDVVNRNEHAYGEIANQVPIGRAGKPEGIASVV